MDAGCLDGDQRAASVPARERLLAGLQRLSEGLHPPGEFRPDDLQVHGKFRRFKMCRDGGIVDLRPCIRMTVRDKVQLIAQLKDLKKKKKNDTGNSITAGAKS